MQGCQPSGLQLDLSRSTCSSARGCLSVLEEERSRSVSTAGKWIPPCAFVKVIKITQRSISLWVTPFTGLFFLAGRVTVREGWTSSQHTSRQHFPILPFAHVISCFDRKQEMITYSHKQAEITSDPLRSCPQVAV